MMFDVKLGLFRFVFANLDDDYYMDSYIKTDFQSYLKMNLLNDGFRYLCFLQKSAVINVAGDYQMILSGGLTESMIKEEPEKKGFFQKIFSKGNNNQNYFSAPLSFEAKTVINANRQALIKYTKNFLEKMGEQSGCALVCPIEIFSSCCEYDDLLNAFITRRNKPNHNIVILTGSVCAEDHDTYFRYLANHEDDDGSIIFNTELFPEPEKYKRSIWNGDGLPQLPNLIFVYDFLKNAFGEKVCLLNEFSYQKLCIMMRYIVMRSKNFPICYSSEYYAAVVYAWYTNEEFRRKYSSLPLSENPLCRFSNVSERISQKEFFESANRILPLEFNGNVNKRSAQTILDYYTNESKGPCILYSASIVDNPQNIHIPAVYYYLTAFRRNLKGHETILRENDLRKLDNMTSYYLRPSYSFDKRQILPHIFFSYPQNDKTIRRLYISLQKKGWNRWDETAMKLLFVLFQSCYKHSNQIVADVVIDLEILARHEFECCMGWIEECLQKSVFDPENSGEADFVYSDIKHALQSEDLNRLKAKKAQGR